MNDTCLYSCSLSCVPPLFTVADMSVFFFLLFLLISSLLLSDEHVMSRAHASNRGEERRKRRGGPALEKGHVFEFEIPLLGSVLLLLSLRLVLLVYLS